MKLMAQKSLPNGKRLWVQHNLKTLAQLGEGGPRKWWVREFLETARSASKQQLALEFLVDVERAFVIVNEIVRVAAHQQSS